MSEIDPRTGQAAPEVAEEFPELRVVWADIGAVPGRSPHDVRERLRLLSGRFRGSQAVAMRQQPIPHSYRVFYRQAGIDPDASRTPVEAAAVARLVRGGFESRSLVDDALTIALVETGVPVWALDAATLDGPLRIRLAASGERLGARDPAARLLPAGRLAVADRRCCLAELFGDPAPGHGVTPASREIRLYALRVAGVPDIHVEEALWTAADVLGAG